MRLADTLSLAWRTIRTNRVRTGITVAIITFGIMALVGILTAIEAMKQKLTDSFSFIGANAFTIRHKERKVNLTGRKTEQLSSKEFRERAALSGQPISWQEARAFQKQYTFPAIVSVASWGMRPAVVSFGQRATSPNIQISGGDEHYIQLNGYEIELGRNFTGPECESQQNVCLLGANVASRLFKGNLNGGLGQSVLVNSIPYRVTGILKPKGSAGFLSFDNVVITTINAFRRQYGGSFIIAVKVNQVQLTDAAIAEATGTFRGVRKLQLTDDNNFVFEKSDRLAGIFIQASTTITFAAIAIGMITLFGAAIGLMNIMMVSVNERTREVGLIKAIGGKQQMIRRQFLAEALLISLAGAVFGIILGLLAGNLVGYFLKTDFVVPWKWVAGGIVLCTLTGLAAGGYPAWKASRLDPITALRYE
jgi:putative ABC transport system permease protein